MRGSWITLLAALLLGACDPATQGDDATRPQDGGEPAPDAPADAGVPPDAGPLVETFVPPTIDPPVGSNAPDPIPRPPPPGSTDPDPDPGPDGGVGGDGDGCGGETPTFAERGLEAGLIAVQAPPNDDPFYDTFLVLEGGEEGGIDEVTPLPGQTVGMRFTGGAAAGDYDGDGFADLYLTRLGGDPVLYRNRGDGTFEDVTQSSQMWLEISRYANGAGFFDADNDGDLDLFVTTAGGVRFRLWINNGSGKFSEQGLLRGISEVTGRRLMGQSVTFGDYDRDGYLDVYTSEWNEYLDGAQSAGRLFHNRGAEMPGFFEDVTDAAGVGTSLGDRAEDFSFTPVFTDLDDDGYPDLAIAGDFGNSRLFWNQGDGSFLDGTVAAGVGTEENGMGAAIGDYDGDGILDWFVTSIFWTSEVGANIGITGNRLYRGLGGRAFEDVTDLAGVRQGYWGWGAVFFDPDNDGDLDLAMANGADLLQWGLEPFITDPSRFWRNDCGAMVERSQEAGLASTGDDKGMLTFDYDLDGDEDMLVVEHSARPRLYENTSASPGEYIRLSFEGTSANRFGIGVRVRVYLDEGAPIVRELRAGGSYLSQGEPVLHIGLGHDVDVIPRIEVVWPNPGTRKVQVLEQVATGVQLHVTEP